MKGHSVPGHFFRDGHRTFREGQGVFRESGMGFREEDELLFGENPRKRFKTLPFRCYHPHILASVDIRDVVQITLPGSRTGLSRISENGFLIGFSRRLNEAAISDASPTRQKRIEKLIAASEEGSEVVGTKIRTVWTHRPFSRRPDR